jgi:hypothetical protein
VTGVCSASLGCTGHNGVQISVNLYKLYPLSYGDIMEGDNNSPTSGRFFSVEGIYARGSMISDFGGQYPLGHYWLRSPFYSGVSAALFIDGRSGYSDPSSTTNSFITRLAGVLDLNKVLITEKLSTNPALGGEVSTSRWAGAPAGDKKFVLTDSQVASGTFSSDAGALSESSILVVNSESTASVSVSGQSAGAVPAYKIVSRGEAGDPPAGVVIGAGEGAGNSVNVKSLYNFWNSDKIGNLPIGNTYDLYLWSQVDKTNSSDSGSAPLKLRLLVEKAPTPTPTPTPEPTPIPSPMPTPNPDPFPNTGVNLPWIAFIIFALAAAGFASFKLRKR